MERAASLTHHFSTLNFKNCRGVSSIISTVIVSGCLLLVLVTASFASLNVLELQLSSAEFEQGRVNMMLLDEVVQDVSLRQGSGGLVQFNLRCFGFNVMDEPSSLKIYVNESMVFESGGLKTIAYGGVGHASASDVTLRGGESLIISMADDPGYLRVEECRGVWVKLDYNRVRVVEMGLLTIGNTSYNFIGVNFIKLESGSFGGSGTINVMAQNAGVETRSYQLEDGPFKINVELGSKVEERVFAGPAIVILTIVEVKVSALEG